MTLPMGYRHIDVTGERCADFLAVDAWAFALPDAEISAANIAETIEWPRSRGIERDVSQDQEQDEPGERELAAVHSSYAYDMRVPGGTVPTSGLTWVGVHPSHRRRGLLTSMIEDHFARSRERGEIISTLFAAETTIYQRFGYGLACPVYHLTLPRGAQLRDVAGSDDLRLRLEDANLAAHAPVVRAVLARDKRPGAMATPSDALLANLFFDPESTRDGHERTRIAIVEDGDGPAAFALFQRKLSYGASGPAGTGESTHGWAAATAAAERRMWSVLADLDLMTSMMVTSVALDSPLVHLLKDVRSVVATMRDQVWLRILDVPAALSARTYLKDVALTIAVEDPLLAENSYPWRFTVANGVATVERAERDTAVDVRLSIQELSAAYLGGTAIDALAAAGLVEEVRPGAVADLSDAFHSRLAPRGSLHF